jgi:hypothetical protein
VEIDRFLSELALPPQPMHPRIARIMREIRIDPAVHIRAEDAAAAVGMSVSHFLRMFATNTGTTFRRYQQWARLRIVGAGVWTPATTSRAAPLTPASPHRRISARRSGAHSACPSPLCWRARWSWISSSAAGIR